ncbi:MAG: acyl-CoA dehydrogenase family protein [Actinobacteria bacterium]|nr:acyl-CoA dehydrogenase family protein [Actinomycetota bacterium]
MATGNDARAREDEGLIRLSDDQQAIISAVREFVEEEVFPVAEELEHRDEYPDAIVEHLKEMGLFGLTIPEEFGGAGMDLMTYALVVTELSRGWMSLSGIMNTHFMAAYLLRRHGSEEQQERFLPRMATGEIRAALSMSEPGAGSDVQAITCRADRDGDEYVVNGAKMWVTNGLRSGVVVLLCKTDVDAEPPYRGMSLLLVEKEPGAGTFQGITIPPNIQKMGYKGVESTELVFEDHRVPARNLLGGEEGKGFAQVMDGIEVGRVNVAARAVGLATRAFEEAIRYAQIRHTFGVPIAQHQGIQFMLAEMATKLEASRLMMMQAAKKKSAGARSDLEAGMAKLFCTEACHQIVTDALRVHGGYGYSAEYPIERLYRDAPFLLIGEGTSEIQRLVIARQLLERYKVQG